MLFERGRGEVVNSVHRTLIALAVSVSMAMLVVMPTWAQAPTRLVFGTNWYPEAEHGGFYQAVAEGLYRKQGLEVTIRPGGPQVNGLQLLLAGQIDLFMGYDTQSIKVLEQDLPVVTVAATFQKDPTVIMAALPFRFRR